MDDCIINAAGAEPGRTTRGFCINTLSLQRDTAGPCAAVIRAAVTSLVACLFLSFDAAIGGIVEVDKGGTTRTWPMKRIPFEICSQDDAFNFNGRDSYGATAKFDKDATETLVSFITEFNSDADPIHSGNTVQLVRRPKTGRLSQSAYIVFKKGVSNNELGGEADPGGYNGNKPHKIGVRTLTPRVVKHEICHILGLLHEHQRRERDKYLDVINWNSVSISYRPQFAKACLSTENNCSDKVTDPKTHGIYYLYGRNISEPYDLRSIMHYKIPSPDPDPAHFVSAVIKSLTKVEGENLKKRWIRDGETIGEFKSLSAGDVSTLNVLYGQLPDE